LADTREFTTSGAQSETGRRERLLYGAAIAALLGIAVMLWAGNGARVFSDMMLGLWALCF